MHPLAGRPGSAGQTLFWGARFLALQALLNAALALGPLTAAAQSTAVGQGTAAPVLTSPLPSGAAQSGLAGSGPGWRMYYEMPASAAQPGAAAAPPSTGAGTGAGYHSPQSPIAPLPQRNDVLPWSVLTNLSKKTTKTRVVPQFNAEQQALHHTQQRVQGFMVPLDAKATQVHFLLTSVPLTCSFCIPGGPESMVEVRAKLPVRHSLEPVVVQGRLELLKDDPYGLYYRLVDAVPVK